MHFGKAMKYTRSRLNTIGKKIISDSTELIDKAQSISIVEDWRKLHSVPLEELVVKVDELLVAAGIKALFSSQRLKRMPSIIGKLTRNKEMGLGGIQDIGGARFVFEKISDVLAARKVIESASFDRFTQVRNTYDYIGKPKDSGYRSIHFVYKYSSDDPDYDGLSVELQIRTRLQHGWATAVETAELISHSPLKSGLGDEKWLEFFRLASVIFARKEQMPVNDQFVGMTDEMTCKQYGELESQYMFLDKLKALVGAVRIASTHSFEKGYAILLIQYDKRTVSFNHFTSQEFDKASELYSKLEDTLTRYNGAVVLVSVADLKELQDAYPSYFLDAGEFISALEAFNRDCVVKGYI